MSRGEDMVTFAAKVWQSFKFQAAFIVTFVAIMTAAEVVYRSLQ